MKKILFIIICLLLATGCQDSATSFELEGNTSTGFEWTCIDDNNLVDINYEIKSTTKNKNLSGSPVIYKFKLTGKKEGKTTIKCTYKRSWEEDGINKEHEYNIIVDSNLNVEIK